MVLETDKIEAYIEKMMFFYDIPGLVLGIGKDNELIYKKAFGYKDIETKEKVDIKTIFHMASITKLVVVTAIMQLAEKGLLQIDDKIVNYLPYFKTADERYREITIKQLLSHTSGLPDCPDYEWDNPEYDEKALENYVKKQNHLQLLCNPGEKFNYSNIGYEVLGDLIAKISKTSFEAYVKKNIFDILEMDSTTLLSFERKKSELATPHIKNKKNEVVVSEIFPYNRVHSPSSTLTSNIEDLSKWAFANLNGGIWNEKRILEAKTYDLIWKPIMASDKEEQICLGWFTRMDHGKLIYGYEASDLGFRASLDLLPKENMFISIHVNTQLAPTKTIKKWILDSIFASNKLNGV